VVSRSLSCRYYLHIYFRVYRPVSDAGERISPSELSDYRVTHNFRLPCCLCAFGREPIIVEAAVYVYRAGELSGLYVAGCATDCCGYLGTGSELLIGEVYANYDFSPPRGPVSYDWCSCGTLCNER
jgi:hypothetical protein